MSAAAAAARAAVVARGWLRENEPVLFPALRFPVSRETRWTTDRNREQIGLVLADMAQGGQAEPQAVPCCLGGTDPVTVAEADRYGLPLRTVIDRRTGLMRSDPYYSNEYIQTFYQRRYRRMYEPADFNAAVFFAEQIQTGERARAAVGADLPPGGRVLEIGCGMGGLLVPFRLHGHTCVGCDYGAEYVAYGRSVGLDLREGGMDTVAAEAPFDLVILSHVVEHQVDPVGFLADVGARLRPGGVVLATVPGIYYISAYYQSRLDHYLQNAHVWHFTGATLAAVLAKAGYTPLRTDESAQCVARWTGRPGSAPVPAGHGEHVIRYLTGLPRQEARLRMVNALKTRVRRLGRMIVPAPSLPNS